MNLSENKRGCYLGYSLLLEAVGGNQPVRGAGGRVGEGSLGTVEIKVRVAWESCKMFPLLTEFPAVLYYHN